MELWSLPRALMATGEWSFMLIQGGIQTIAHPINASRALYKTLQHLVSEKKAKEWGNFVKSQPFYDEMKRAGLSLSEYDAKLNAREEQFLGGWVNYLWDYLGYPTKFISKNLYENWKSINPLKALERASVAYMNTLRILRYQQGKEMLYKQGKNFNDDPDSFKNMADVINTFTGRAKLGPFEGSSRALSILKTSTPWALYHFGKMGDKGTFKPSVAQKMAMADYMKFVLFTAGLVAMAALHYNGDDDDETEVVLDPTSSDFLKIKLGDTRIDPWGGRLQMIVYQARMIQGAMTTGGEKKKLGEGLTPTYTELTLRTIQSKLAPTAALLVKAGLTEPDKEGNRKLFGKEFIMSEELAGTLYPMYIGTLNELWKEQPETVSSFLTLYAFLGGGVQTYETKKSEPLFKEGEFEYNPRKYNSFESDSWQTITENTKEPMTKEFKDILSEMIQIETKKTIEENKGTGSYKEYMKSEEGMEKWTGKNRDIAIKKVKVEFNSIVKSKLNNVDKMSPEEKTQAIFSARQQAVDQLMLKYNMVKED
jgi:hypothetical protein